MEDLSFLGKGMKFPPQIDKSTGRFAVSEGYDSIKESLYLILMTQKGERWLAPNFGSDVNSFTFMDTSLTMLSVFADSIREVIYDQEPRITDVEVHMDATSKEGCVFVNIAYRVTETNTTDNMVFPFYLNTIDEEAGFYDE